MDNCSILSPLGMLGYGIPEDSISGAISDNDIDAIVSDAGSIDPGPNYLGIGESFTDRDMVKRDLRILLKAQEEIDVPLLIGSAGGAGAQPHLEWADRIVKEIAREEGLTFSLARIYTDVDREYLRRKRDAKEIAKLDYDVELTDEQLEETSTMVAQVGSKPFVAALEAGVDVVLGGRASDLAPFMAVPQRNGFDPGLSGHMAKILECGAHATVSGSGDDALLGILAEDHFDVVPPNPDKRCTVESV